MKSRANDICTHCGASESIHRHDTWQCPKNGVEGLLWDDRNGTYFPQRWEETTFEDSGARDFEMKAVQMHDELVDALRRLTDAHFNGKVQGTNWINASEILKKASE